MSDKLSSVHGAVKEICEAACVIVVIVLVFRSCQSGLDHNREKELLELRIKAGVSLESKAANP